MMRNNNERASVKIPYAKIVRAVVGSAQLEGYIGSIEAFEASLETRAKASRRKSHKINQESLEQPVRHSRQAGR